VFLAPVDEPFASIVTTFSPGYKYSYILKLGSASDLLYHLVNAVEAPDALFTIVYVTDKLSEDSPSSL
jgi:hypothetical protein